MKKNNPRKNTDFYGKISFLGARRTLGICFFIPNAECPEEPTVQGEKGLASAS
jgi:hypothetical protein